MTTPATPARVLLVEDSSFNIAYVRELLGDHGCLVDAATNGRAALGLFAPGKYDLVLMDCQMPIMDGYEATAAMRAVEAAAGSARARIVAMTADATAGVRERCSAVGMDAVLIKPFSPEEFRSLLAGA